MRIIVNGQQAFGKAALEAILEEGKDEVVAVYTAPDKEGRPFDPLKQAALDHGIPLYQPASYKEPKVLDEMRALKPDLMVMAYVTIFIPEQARSIPTHGSICFHPSLLPKHRGPSSINWPMIQGATKTGLTYFWPNDGLDEGDILLQKEVEIGPDDTLGDVYFNHLFPMGVSAMVEAADLVIAGRHTERVQDESQASYEGWCRDAEARIHWAHHVDFIYNLIRGCNPAPGAWTTLNGQKIQIFDARKHPYRRFADVAGKIGEVSGVTEASFRVSAQGGAIEVLRARGADGKKVSGGDFARGNGLSAGVLLGS
jgi:methionyl-tRNA formyltransferase